jgi:hydroxyacylglutathione hydrolase
MTSKLGILSLILGPVETNAYLAVDLESGEAAAIDPAWDGELIVSEAQRHGWRISQVWFTHAHFDHIAGAAAIINSVQPSPRAYLHPGDLQLYRMQGGAPLFGLRIDRSPEPVQPLAAGQFLQLGKQSFQVRHTPGHTLGHVIFYHADEEVVFCGDLIFKGSVGRTDLPGGSHLTLLESLRNHVLSLPDGTRLLSGHGPETTVGEERINNPFLTYS